MRKVTTVYFDGLYHLIDTQGNGVVTYGFVVYENSNKIYEECNVFSEGKELSNNVAEFSGLIAALTWLMKRGYKNKPVTLRSDSLLVVNTINGTWTPKNGMYYPYYIKASSIIKEFKQVKLEWVPREKNKEADKLCKTAYETYIKLQQLKF